MSLEKRINAFVELGRFLTQYSSTTKNESLKHLNKKFYTDFEILIKNQKPYNGWFTPENVNLAVNSIAGTLTKEELKQWLNNYLITEPANPKRIGVVMAGNIPLVGFHDFLSVLMTGNIILAKTSKEDSLLIKKIADILIAIEPDFKSHIVFTERLENFDAVIATGSNNTARYFEFYFGKYPNIIRKNRNSVAVLTGDENVNDFVNLGKDIFQYFGLGCRNVSKLYVPKNYNFKLFFESILDDYNEVINNNKYANNYDYNKAVYLLGNNKILDNNFVMLKESEALSSPVSVIHYEYYNSMEELLEKLNQLKDQVQCVVSKTKLPNSFGLGLAQQPELWDYADGVDTIKFLLDLT